MVKYHNCHGIVSGADVARVMVMMGMKIIPDEEGWRVRWRCVCCLCVWSCNCR